MTLVRRYGSLLHYPELCDCLSSARSHVSCISSQKNSQTGQGLRPRSPYRVVRAVLIKSGLLDQEVGRSSEVH